jgi:glutathione S-transferase
VQNAFQLNYYPERFCQTEEGYPNAMGRGVSRLRETWKIIDSQIGMNEWVLGDNFSAVDIYLFMLTTWLSESRGHPSIQEFPNVARVARRVLDRPATKEVYSPLSYS